MTENKRPGGFRAALADPARKPFAVELDSPEGPDIAKFLSGAAELRDAGAQIITVADCPVARPRMDAALCACLLRERLGAEALPHMTCRDRNRNALRAQMLGLYAAGVRDLLLVTGDPVPPERRQEIKSVYNFNSRSLIAYAAALNRELPEPFHLCAALDVNARDFAVQLRLAKEKEANGAACFFTQPVLTRRALENLKQARRELRGRVAGGIIPIVSQRNALFMDREIPGISVDEQIIRLYEGADRQRGEELALAVSAAVAAEIAPYIDGYYLMTPFGRSGLMVRLMDRLRLDGEI